MKATLTLADGTSFAGRAFGSEGEAAGEVVFNTSMTGYQEILTDPSYEGQLVTMTYPEIGNVGVNPEDDESRRPYVKGFIVKEYCPVPSSWRATRALHAYMQEHGHRGHRRCGHALPGHPHTRARRPGGHHLHGVPRRVGVGRESSADRRT